MATSERIRETLYQLRKETPLVDLLRYHYTLDMQERMERRAAKAR